ncbi:MAG: FtsX-like permease family protein [Planctomycetota bacterium]
MSLTSFVVSRNWASSRLRVLLTLVGIALGVAIVVAIFVMDHNTIQSRLQKLDPERGWVDLEVVPVQTEREVADVQAELRAIDGVRDVAVWSEARGVAVGKDPQKPLPLSVFGIGPLPADVFAHYIVNRGQDLGVDDEQPAADGSYGVLLGGEAAHLLGVDVGDRLQLAEPPPQPRVACRNGELVQLPFDAQKPAFAAQVVVRGVLEHHKLGKRAAGLCAVVPFGLAAKLRMLTPSLYHVLREPGSDLDRLRQTLRRSGTFTVQDVRAAMIGEGADERAFRNGLKILGGLALLLGMYVVFQTLCHSLVSRIRQLGLLRCLGAGTGAITRIFLLDALLLGVVGSGIGIGLGLLLAKWLQSRRVSSLGLGKDWATFDLPWQPLVWTGLLGVLFTLAGAMFPLVRARQIPALDILRAGGSAPGTDDGVDLLRGVHVWMFGLLVVALPLAYLGMTPLAVEEGQETRSVLLQLVGVLGLFGAVLLLAPGLTSLLGRLLLLPARPLAPMASWLVGKVLGRSAGRVSAAVCGLSAVLLATLGLKTLTDSLVAEVDVLERTSLQHRLFVQCEPTTTAVAEQLAKVPGVARVEAFEGEVRSGGFLLRGLDVAAAGASGGPLEGDPTALRRYVDPQARTLIASSRLARLRQWRAGDLVAMRDRNGSPVSYEVLLVDDRAGFDGDERAFAITSPTWLKRDFCVGDLCVGLMCLHLDAGRGQQRLGSYRNLEPVRAAVRANVKGLIRNKSGAEIASYFRRDVLRDFRLFDLLLFLMLVLAGVGLLNGMTIAALGRMRELGVLRALGMKRSAIGGSFVLEGLVTAAIASVLSLGLSIPLGRILVFGMNAVARIEAPVAMPWRWFVWVPLAAFGIALLASLPPAWRALRQSPSESVRYE